MKSSLVLFLVFIILSIAHLVIVQSQEGFISLDCGLPASEPSPYKEDSGLWYSSDEKFIQSGELGVNRDIDLPVGATKQYQTVRYFPKGIRNCYNLNVDKGRKYLIRATFVYGNYDGLDTKPMFDLYLGPNLWAEIDFRRVMNGTASKEILYIPTSNGLQICIVKTGESTPLITSLELRPMGTDSYIIEDGSLSLYYRNYLSMSTSQIRYPGDIYDRQWVSSFKEDWTQIYTDSEVDNINGYNLPKAALATAVVPTSAHAPLTIEWTSELPDDKYYFYAHFAELEDLQANETREFSLVCNGEIAYDSLVPTKLNITTISCPSPQTCKGGKCSIQLIRTKRSTMPPLLNAFEVYTVTQLPQSETNETDVRAIKDFASNYELSKIDWQGDPCVPQKLKWDGLDCDNKLMSTPPRIIYLNLTSNELTGPITDAIQRLTELEVLDLSNNKLTGEIPEFLGNMPSLTALFLCGNSLKGSVPVNLIRKGFKLSVVNNPKLCVSGKCKKKFPVVIVASVSFAAVAIIVLVIFLVLRRKKSTTPQGLQPLTKASTMSTFANNKSKRFKYSEVVKMTNNFQRVLGKGGFGMVYHGTVNGSEHVAVKVLSQSSTQGYKEFKAEVDLLLRVHHTNLVKLVGYCYEGDHLALIYEFMADGDLKQHLSGKGGRSIINWSIRLQIALEAAQGLEYLHNGCTPTMVHRDVKTANILLDDNFKAKLADFGLSRSSQGGGETFTGTGIAGTPGYLDPESHFTSRLTEKSDVYSFGIVLLEMITNQPVINMASSTHITQWVALKLKQGDIINIMDPNLRGDYDSNSAWRALELAMSCANPSSTKRPSMSRVINELKECIVCDNSGTSKNSGLDSQEAISLDASVLPMAR